MVMESGTFNSWDTHVPCMITETAITLCLLIAEKTEPDSKVAKQVFL